jgi:hypothetical protein
MTAWVAPPETMWGEIYVCFNNKCPFYRTSPDLIENKGGGNRLLGCRYAEDPANGYKSFNLLAICPF